MLSNWHRKVYKKKMKKDISADDWLKIKSQCLKHYKYTCYRCEKVDGQGRGMTAHHIIPRSEGGSNDQKNLVALCNPCHDAVEISDARSLVDIVAGYDGGYIEPAKQLVGVKENGESFVRPAWHRWVYGGARHEQGRTK